MNRILNENENWECRTRLTYTKKCLKNVWHAICHQINFVIHIIHEAFEFQMILILTESEIRDQIEEWISSKICIWIKTFNYIQFGSHKRYGDLLWLTRRIVTNSWINSLLCIGLLSAKIQFNNNNNHRISMAHQPKKNLNILSQRLMAFRFDNEREKKKRSEHAPTPSNVQSFAKNGSLYKVFNFELYANRFIALNSIDRSIDRLLWCLLVSLSF